MGPSYVEPLHAAATVVRAAASGHREALGVVHAGDSPAVVRLLAISPGALAHVLDLVGLGVNAGHLAALARGQWGAIDLGLGVRPSLAQGAALRVSGHLPSPEPDAGYSEGEKGAFLLGTRLARRAAGLSALEAAREALAPELQAAYDEGVIVGEARRARA